MDKQSVDHSKEIETRLKAIRVSKSDTCVFFKCRDGCIISFQQCQYCRFSDFTESNHTNLSGDFGLCKFRK